MQHQRAGGGNGGKERIGRIGRIGIGGRPPYRDRSEGEQQNKYGRAPTANHPGHNSGLYGGNVYGGELFRQYNVRRK